MSKSLQEALEDAGFEPRSYSGRGMFGAECLAVYTPFEPNQVLFRMGQACADIKPTPDVRTDNLGRGYIIYFPDVDWEGDSAPIEDEE